MKHPEVYSVVLLLIILSFSEGHELDCDFHGTTCNWHNVGDGLMSWTPETFTPDQNSYLIFKPSWGSEGNVATLQSPLVTGSKTAQFNFTYWMVVGGSGELRVRMESYTSSKETQVIEQTVLFERSNSSYGKHNQVIHIHSQSGVFRLFVDAVVGDGFYGLMHLDDFRFRARCEDDLCQNGGTCVSDDDGYVRCECQSDFDGELCERKIFTDELCKGVEAKLIATPDTITPYLTNAFGVKCYVNMTVPSLENAMCRTRKPVTFMAVTSIVIKRLIAGSGEKQPVAMVSTYDKPISHLEKENVRVNGHVSVAGQDTSNKEEMAYLRVDWMEANQSQASSYECHVSGLDTTGESWEAEVKVKVNLKQATLDDLQNKIQELLKKVHELETANEFCPRP